MKYMYAIALKPIAMAGGVENLDPQKRLMFEGMMLLMSKLFEAANEIDDVRTTEEYTIIVSSSTDVYDTLNKLAGNAIISRLDPDKYEFTEGA